MSEAFSHLRVVDCSNRLSGAWAARLFGDFGAEVILLESGEGHALRREAPFSQSGESLMHAYANWNKVSVRDEEADVETILKSADVVY